MLPTLIALLVTLGLGGAGHGVPSGHRPSAPEARSSLGAQVPGGDEPGQKRGDHH